MKSVSGKELASVLDRNGWQLLRVHGSHHIYGKPGVSGEVFDSNPWQCSIEEGPPGSSSQACGT
jgi:hypothetical protein